ncbi:response regulator transcription factor [Paenibacillus sp.]|uniref:response regulator transcription factor n=1 Tax=Paenibacillus sp. TaxID=58172 RepID=UPI002D291B07|nr:response regulator transcription factor [Paenibacillus sp.]HZG87744.1 response regulator transcription factor [Paenibacillus sp.]
MKTIMVVEDEPRMQDLICDYLQEQPFRLLRARDGRQALEAFAKDPADLVILDVMMPFVDGFEVCRTLRRKSDVLIVILTAKSEEADKLLGYELGADDYVTKPFSPKVLVAKVRALLKRAERSGSDVDAALVRAGDLEINEATFEARLRGEPLALTPKEFDLLLFMCRNRNLVLSRDQLLDSVWGHDYFGDVRTVDTHVKRLRQKLGHCADWIRTVRGNGYMLKAGD